MSAAMHHAIMLLPTGWRSAMVATTAVPITTGRGATMVATATTAAMPITAGRRAAMVATAAAVPITTERGATVVAMIIISAVTAAEHANNRGATRNIPR